MVAYLPPESATKTAVRDSMTPEELAALPRSDTPTGHGAWSHLEMLSAAIADGIAVLAWQNGVIHGGSKAEMPAPIARPGVARDTGISEAGRAALAQLRASRLEAIPE